MKAVIDASFIASLFLPDETNDKTTALIQHIARDGAVVPALWQLEVTNMLLMAERRKRLNASEVSQVLEAMDALPITLQPTLSFQQRSEILNLARQHNLTSYDASYLELSMRLGLPLATLDKSLQKAATAVGVRLLNT